MPQVGPSLATAVFSLSCFLVLGQVVGNRPPVTQEEIPSGTGWPEKEVAAASMLQRSAMPMAIVPPLPSASDEPDDELLLDAHEWSRRLRASLSTSAPGIEVTEHEGPSCVNTTGAKYLFTEHVCVLDWSFQCECKEGVRGVRVMHYNSGCGNSSTESAWIPLNECLDSSHTASGPSLYFKVDDFDSCPSTGAACTVYGDPHITVFDQADVALFGSIPDRSRKGLHGGKKTKEGRADHFDIGDYWLVKSELISVQARYQNVYYPKAHFQNRSYLTRIAVGGPFLQGHMLVIGPRDTGKIELLKPDGVLYEVTNDTSRFEVEGLIRLRATDHALKVQDKSRTTPGIYVSLPSDVTLNVNRFGQHIDFSITMPPGAGGPGGIDGQCGNYNGDPTDDSAELITERMGYQIPQEDLFFSKVASAYHTSKTDEDEENDADTEQFSETRVEQPELVGEPVSTPMATIYLFDDDDCTVPLQAFNQSAFYEFSASATHCELGWNLTCACNGTNKRLKAARYKGGCQAPQHIEVYDIVPQVCHPPVPPVHTVYWKVDLDSCPTCECDDTGPEASCTVHGDPHITVFDHHEVSFVDSVRADAEMMSHEGGRTAESGNAFGWGDYWLVKSAEVFIQARYRRVYMPNAGEKMDKNHTFLTGVAVGGPFLHDHKVVIEPRDGEVTWTSSSGVSYKILESPGTDFEIDDVLKAKYHQRPSIMGEHLGRTALGIDMELPSGVKLRLDRFGKHLNLEIRMPQSAGGPGGVDGQCGNYNGDPDDDTPELIRERMGEQRVFKNRLLFEPA